MLTRFVVAATATLLLGDGPRAHAQEVHRIPGGQAWEAARAAGFEFYPVPPDDGYILTGSRDGAATALKACASSHSPCVEEARFRDGAIELPPGACRGCEAGHVFELYGGRPLADGWRLVRVEVAGEGWSFEREPAYDTADPAFALRLRGPAGRAAVVTLTLEGPAGEPWRAAFEGRP